MAVKGAVVQFFVALAASCAFLSFGAVRSWSSPAIPSLLSSNLINQTDVPTISSLSPLGAVPGAFMAGPLMNRFGRRLTLIGVAIPWTAMFILLSFANNIEVFYVSRFVLGIMMGIATPTAQLYISECVDSKRRGAFGSLTALLHAAGILICYTAGKYLRWDHLSQVLATFPFMLLIGMIFSPPSPVWLAMKSKSNVALKSLALLSGTNPNNHEVLATMERLTSTNNQGPSLGFRQRMREMTKFSALKPLFLSVTVMIFQQFSGINSVIFHTVLIFQLTEANIDSNLSTIIVGLTLFIFTIVTIFVIDRLGRKVLLLISGCIMSLSTGLLGIFFYLKDNELIPDIGSYGWVPISCLITFVAAYSIGYNNVPFILMGELFPRNVKNTFSSISMMVHLTCSFLIVFSFPILAQVIGGSGVFWLYSAVSFLGVPFVFFFLPETKGKTLEDIEKMFQKTAKVRDDEQPDCLNSPETDI